MQGLIYFGLALALVKCIHELGHGYAVFIPEVPQQPRVTGVIDLVDSANAEHLTIHELTSHYDGPIAATKVNEELEPLKAWYRVNVLVKGTKAVTRASRGTLLAQGEAESLAVRFWRRAAHVVLREVLI